MNTLSKTYERSDFENCGANHKYFQKPSRSNATIGKDKASLGVIGSSKGK